MHKIYSRRRIRLPKYLWDKNKDKKIVKKKIYITCILVVSVMTLKYILDTIDPIFEILARDEAKSLGTIISNEEATKVMKKYEYDDLFMIEKDEEQNINVIKSNMITINEITSDIAKNIEIEFDKKEDSNIQIPIGSIIGIPIFSGTGFNFNVEIVILGSVETELKNEFISEGINQTIHRVYLDVNSNMKILTAFEEIEEVISNQVLLLENLIIGEIPTNYYNFNGMEGKDVLEMVE